MSPIGVDPQVTAAGASGLANVEDVLRGLSISGQGVMADKVREQLAKNGKHAQFLSNAAQEVHKATERYEANAAAFDNANPTDAEIAQAQQDVVNAAKRAADGTGSEEDVEKAVDHLSQLLAAREKAKKDRADADDDTTDDLKDGTSDFMDPTKNPGAMAQPSPQQPPAGEQPPASGGGGSPMGGAGASPSPELPFSGANDLGKGSDGLGKGWDDDSYGGTRLSGADSGVVEDIHGDPKTLRGVSSAADTSGRGNSTMFAGTGTPVSGTSGGAGMGGMPMGGMPMGGMGGMGGRGGGGKDKPRIITDDPFLTGNDMHDEHSTSGDLSKES